LIVERKSKDDPIFDDRKVKNNAIDYRLPIDSSNLGRWRQNLGFGDRALDAVVTYVAFHNSA